MIKLKGKKVFTKQEADTLRILIKLRVKAERSEQKRIIKIKWTGKIDFTR